MDIYFPYFPKKMSNSRRENLQNELKNIFGQYFFFIQNPNRSQFNSKKTNTPIFRKQNWLRYWIDILKNNKAIIGGTYNVKI